MKKLAGSMISVIKAALIFIAIPSIAIGMEELPLSPRTKEAFAKREFSHETYTPCREAEILANSTKNPETAYQLWIQAFCGNGVSEFSKAFTRYVTESVNKFCASEELFTGDMYEIKKKCIEIRTRFQIIRDNAMAGDGSGIGYTSSQLAEAVLETGKRDDALVWQKTAIFWLLVASIREEVYEPDLANEIETLTDMMKK